MRPETGTLGRAVGAIRHTAAATLVAGLALGGSTPPPRKTPGLMARSRLSFHSTPAEALTGWRAPWLDRWARNSERQWSSKTGLAARADLARPGWPQQPADGNTLLLIAGNAVSGQRDPRGRRPGRMGGFQFPQRAVERLRHRRGGTKTAPTKRLPT